MRGELVRAYPYAEMREDALGMARRLAGMGIGKDDRVALIADTCPEFAALFCACVYVGRVARPAAAADDFRRASDSYIDQLKVQLESSDPNIAAISRRNRRDGQSRRRPARLRGRRLGRVRKARCARMRPARAAPDDICYLQYSSGSTRFPIGVAVTHAALLHNLFGHSTAIELGKTTVLSAGCPGITTWAWSAASYRPSRTR